MLRFRFLGNWCCGSIEFNFLALGVQFSPAPIFGTGPGPFEVGPSVQVSPAPIWGRGGYNSASNRHSCGKGARQEFQNCKHEAKNRFVPRNTRKNGHPSGQVKPPHPRPLSPKWERGDSNIEGDTGFCRFGPRLRRKNVAKLLLTVFRGGRTVLLGRPAISGERICRADRPTMSPCPACRLEHETCSATEQRNVLQEAKPTV
jgi:hypothetical protein